MHRARTSNIVFNGADRLREEGLGICSKLMEEALHVIVGENPTQHVSIT